VIFLQGARQAGKSTLVKALAKSEHPATYLSLDTAAVLAAATADPEGV
jgi:predicted AAA+ superfamily ATPase